VAPEVNEVILDAYWLEPANFAHLHLRRTLMHALSGLTGKAYRSWRLRDSWSNAARGMLPGALPLRKRRCAL
jgi:hypothetical protein